MSVCNEVSAADVIAALAALPGSRRLAAAAPITFSVEVAGIEIATPGDQPEAALRRTWRDRHRGAIPLLLLSDHSTESGVLATLGPSDGISPVRLVEAGALVNMLRRASSMPRLEAIREVAAELQRLDQAGIPGLRLRDLLTMHTLDVRLRRDVGRWSAAETVAAAVPVGSDWRTIITSLGYQVDRRPVRGYLLRSDGRPVAVVHPKADAAEFARLDADGRPPEGALLNDTVVEGVAYGLLVAGARFRLFDFGGGAGTTARYLDLDASVLRSSDRPLLALLSPLYLAGGGFEDLVAEASAFGAALRKRLDERIRIAAFPALARGLEAWARQNGLNLGSEAELAELEKAARHWHPDHPVSRIPAVSISALKCPKRRIRKTAGLTNATAAIP